MKEKLHFCGVSTATAIKEALRFYQIKKTGWSILTLLLLFVSIESWAQVDPVEGDYRSLQDPSGLPCELPEPPCGDPVNGIYYWNNHLNWEVYHQTGSPKWRPATITDGYPGEKANSTTVTILDGDTITLDETNNLPQLFNEYVMETITIDGELSLIGKTNDHVEFYLNTDQLIVTAIPLDLPTDGGVIRFTSKVKLLLPADASIDVRTNEPINNPIPNFDYYYGLVNETSCNHNQQIHIGEIVIAFCQGAPGVSLTFLELMQSGGELRRIINYSPVNCSDLTVYVTGGLVNDTFFTLISYTWTVTETLDGGTELDLDYSDSHDEGFVLPINETSSYEIIFEPTIYSDGEYTNKTKTATLSFAPTIWQYHDDPDPLKSYYYWAQSDGTYVSPEYTLRAEIKYIDDDDDIDYDTGVDGSFSTCFMTVVESVGDDRDANLTIGANSYVSVYNDIENDGTIIVEHEGSLVQKASGIDTNTIPNTGTYQIHKNSREYSEYDYTYWSSPVDKGAISEVFAANPSDYIFKLVTSNFLDIYDGDYMLIDGNYIQSEGNSTSDHYDDDNNDWQIATGDMTRGKGYMAMGEGAFTTPINSPDPFPRRTQSVLFEDAKVNNGYITVPVTLDLYNENNGPGSGGFYNFNTNANLIGNPYPSAIDIKKLKLENDAILTGTFYFWTHDTPLSSDNLGPWGEYNYTYDDYAVAVTDGTTFDSIDAGPNDDGTAAPEFIASGQGFLANVEQNITNPSNIVFNNDMRVTGDNNSFKNQEIPIEVTPIDRLWINLSQYKSSLFRQILVGFREGATDDYQNGQDGQGRGHADHTDFYSIIPNDSRHFAIQNLATFKDSKTVALGLEISDAGEYVISIDRVEGIFAAGQEVYLEDIYTNQLHNLTTDGEYVFSSVPGKAIKDRFILRFTEDRSAVKTTNQLLNALVIYPNPSNNIFNIGIANDETIDLEVYDLSGKILLRKNHTTTRQIDLSGYAPGFYFAKIQLDGQHVVKKLVLK